MAKTGEKIYYVKVAQHELDNIELAVRKRMIEMIMGDICEHSKSLATTLLQGKPLTKKKWYQPEPKKTN